MHSSYLTEVENNWVEHSSNVDFKTANYLLQSIITLYMYLIYRPKKGQLISVTDLSTNDTHLDSVNIIYLAVLPTYHPFFSLGMCGVSLL